MKKIIFLFLILHLSSFIFPVYAVDATPAAVATKSATPVEKKAQDLLDRVATKVAQLATTTKRTYHGTIKSVGKSSYVITTPEGDRTIETNDATDFYRIRAGKRSETNFAGIKKDEDIVAIGAIDPGNKTMTASQVITKIKRTIVIGPIETLDKSIATVKGAKVDLTDASYQKIDLAGKISAATLADFKVGSTVFLLTHSPEDGIYSSLKALVVLNQ